MVSIPKQTVMCYVKQSQARTFSQQTLPGNWQSPVARLTCAVPTQVIVIHYAKNTFIYDAIDNLGAILDMELVKVRILLLVESERSGIRGGYQLFLRTPARLKLSIQVTHNTRDCWFRQDEPVTHMEMQLHLQQKMQQKWEIFVFFFKFKLLSFWGITGISKYFKTKFDKRKIMKSMFIK